LGPNATGPSATSPATTDGGEAVAVTVASAAALVRKVTNAGGRKHRGRIFLCGVPEEDVDNASNIEGAALTNLQGAMDTLLADAETNNLRLMVLHGDATAPSLITSLAVQSKVATQRRRLRR
jgi:hypothetical protein